MASKWKKKEAPERVPFELGFPPSDTQVSARECLLNSVENMFAEAVAGSGKSTTLAYLMTFTKIKGAYVAFNKDIVAEMEPKCPHTITVKTRHAFGYAAFVKEGIRLKIEGTKLEHVLKECGFEVTKEDEDSYERCQSIRNLIDQMRNNLVDPTDHEGMDRLMYFYNIDIDEYEKVFMKMPMMFQKIVELGMEGIIDFIDMKWLPVHMNWKIPQFDILFLDEYQDSSNLDMAFDKMMLKAGGRVCIVGDARQSIYGFAGANCDSIDIAKQEFAATHFPLHTTYRCHKEITNFAKRIVPYIQSWDKLPDGRVVRFNDPYDPSQMNPHAMVLCRRNAPLVKPCFKALKAGIKANIKGRDIGANLISIINKLRCGDDLAMMLGKLDDHMAIKREKILNRKKPSAHALELLEDQQNIIESFAEDPDINDVPTLKRHIKDMFTESDKGMVFSSIHRSKGLESEHVVLLDYPNIRIANDRMTEEAHTQEANLEYVAITRAKGNLYLECQKK